MIVSVLVVIAAAVVLVVIHMRSPAASVAAPCHPSSVIGKPVAGGSLTMCDTETGRKVQISMSGVPNGKRIALQAGDLVFVVADNRLLWRPVAGNAKWTDLGPVPAGGQQAMCLSGPSVVVVAQAPTTGAGTKSTASWTEVTVPAKSPVALGPQQQVAVNVCAAGAS